MTSLETLLEALKVYEIEVISIEDAHVKLQNTYDIEVEKNVQIISDADIIAPFGDLNDLCRFLSS